MRNVFLTGATGFLGGEVAVALSKIESIDKIFCLVRAKSDAEADERLKRVFDLHADFYDPNKLTAIPGDLTDEHLTEKLLARTVLQRTDVIAHAGANTSFLPQRYPLIEQTNVGGTQKLIGWATTLSSLQQFVYVGTATIVGAGADVTGQTIYEDQSPNPDAHHLVGYTRSKARAETIIREVIEPGKFLVLRPSILLGDTRSLVPRSFDIAWIVIAIKQLRMFFSNPDAHCDIIPVDYAANAIVELMLTRRQYDTYHVSAGSASTTCRQIGEAVGYEDPGKPPLVFCSREDLEPFKKWLRSGDAPDSCLSKYADHLAYIQFELGKKKARMLLSGLEAYWRFIDLGQRFDNSRLLAETALGLPEAAHDYIPRTAAFLEDLDPIAAAVNP